MKKQLTLLVMTATLTATTLFAQKPMESPRKDASGTVKGTTISINYGSPSVKGRKIWGDLVPYKEVWRTGANESTRVTFSKDVMIGGKKLGAGTYSFFAIPAENKEWTIIFNTKNQWGAYKYSEKEDVLRTVVKAKETAFTEQLTYVVTSTGFSLKWEKLEVPVAIQ